MRKKILISLIILIVVLGGFFGITFYHLYDLIETYSPIVEGNEDRIVFFDIGKGDRASIGRLIDSVAACNPKVMAIDVFFDQLKDPIKDSLLRQSLKKDNLVLARKIENQTTHPYFLEQAASTGFAQSISLGRFTSATYYPRYGNQNHFSLAIAQMYDSISSHGFTTKNKKGELEIIFTRLEHQFKVYEFGDFEYDCESIAGKIAYLGYFGNDEDLHVTRARYHEKSTRDIGKEMKADMHGSVVVANQILMILDDIQQP